MAQTAQSERGAEEARRGAMGWTTVMQRYADTRLGQVHLATAGRPESPALILLPQAGRSISMFRELMNRLAASYYVVAMNYPGTGGSATLAPDVTMATIAATVVDVMDSLQIQRAYVYGIHTGNKVGLALAAQWPERLIKLVFAGQSHSIVPFNEQRRKTVGKTKNKWIADGDERQIALVQWADMFSSLSQAWWNDELMCQIANPDMRARVLVEAIDGLQGFASIAHLYKANRAYDMEGDLRKLNIPTLFLEICTPAEDREIGRQGEALVSIVAGSSLTTIEMEDGHGITLEQQTERLTEILCRYFV